MTVENYALRHDLEILCDETSLLKTPLWAKVLAPEVIVSQDSAHFPKLDIGEKARESFDTRRNNNGESNRTTFKVGESDYFTEPFVHETILDRLQTKIGRQYYDGQKISGDIVKTVLNLGRERRVQFGYQNTAGYTAIHASNVVAAGNPWSNKSTATPLANVDALSARLYATKGLKKGVADLIIADDLLLEVIKCNEILANMSGLTNPDTWNLATAAEYLASYLHVNSVVPVSGTVNTAGINGTAQFAEMWNPDFIELVVRPASGNFAIPGFARQPVYPIDTTDIFMDSYTEQRAQQMIIRGQEYRGNQFDYEWGVILTGTNS